MRLLTYFNFSYSINLLRKVQELFCGLNLGGCLIIATVDSVTKRRDERLRLLMFFIKETASI